MGEEKAGNSSADSQSWCQLDTNGIDLQTFVVKGQWTANGSGGLREIIYLNCAVSLWSHESHGRLFLQMNRYLDGFIASLLPSIHKEMLFLVELGSW